MIRKGFGHLISKLITLGDFVCLNVAFLLLLYFYPDTFTDALSRRIVCLLLNLSYLPIAFFFRYVHNMRIVCIDRLLLIASESVFFSFLVFSACMACVKVYIDSTRLLLLFAFGGCYRTGYFDIFAVADIISNVSLSSVQVRRGFLCIMSCNPMQDMVSASWAFSIMICLLRNLFRNLGVI